MNNKEKTTEQIIVEEKAIAIIESCEDYNHIISATSYLDLFMKTFDDEEAYDFLDSLLKTKQTKLNCYVN